ncbi:Zn-dependent exopeptidase [Periconia macrospinosa]|uniref:Zn-dependent exopeptidase n=1 Tax=Periconia macrospinosa TaxID=97972 RepID=A0A2V1DMB7_9PLEO|nr:Zn-dependent exopeptidase [Periconia macrospinosa]
MKLYLLCSFALVALSASSFDVHTQHFINDGQDSSLVPLLDLHRELVERNSVTGSEHNISRYLDAHLRAIGFHTELQPVIDGRENVFAYLGHKRETRVLVTSHIDTVPPYIPYERRGDTIWGRGSADAKASVAAQITAVKRLYDERQIDEGDVALLFVVGEEKDGHGMKTANDLGLSWESVIFGEPTELKLATGHKGGLAFTISAAGIAGHSGYPEVGRNAIDILVQGLSALSQLQLPGSDRFGNTTLNVGLIEGGKAANVIAQNASAVVMVRIASDDLDGIKTLIQHAVTTASPWLEIDFLSPGIPPVPIDSDIEGFETVIVNYGTDIPSLKGSHKRYLYGPGSILVAHSAHEHVDVADLSTAVDGYERLITQVLERPRPILWKP